jgi:hypothetical protein
MNRRITTTQTPPFPFFVKNKQNNQSILLVKGRKRGWGNHAQKGWVAAAGVGALQLTRVGGK